MYPSSSHGAQDPSDRQGSSERSDRDTGLSPTFEGVLNRTSEGPVSFINSSFAAYTVASPSTSTSSRKPLTWRRVSFGPDNGSKKPETIEDLESQLKDQAREIKILQDKLRRRDRTMEALRADLRGVEQALAEKKQELAAARVLAGLGGGQEGPRAEGGRTG